MMCLCDAAFCFGACGTVPYVAPTTRADALMVARRRVRRIRRARGVGRWWPGGWRPVVVSAWWSALPVHSMPF
jgi:hypothetical protein